MRILLAVDGSVSSDHATQLVNSLALPDGSVIRAVAVQEPTLDALGMTWLGAGDEGVVPDLDESLSATHFRDAVAVAERTLARPGRTVEGFLLKGRPGSQIVDEAKAFEADLVVVGSRGHGTIATMVLGSTASEVVDHAPCPVLVARGDRLGRVAFADDGSPSARTAEEVLGRWPIFDGVDLRVVGVAEVAVPMAAGFTAGLYDQVMASYTQSVDAARKERRDEVAATAARLATSGRTVKAELLEGDPAHTLIEYARTDAIGTMVLGTHGRTGFARLVLGSVARNVLLHVACSVLVVRERKG